MALNKSINCKSGYAGNYLSISALIIDNVSKKANFTLSIYKDSSLKDSDNYLEKRYFNQISDIASLSDAYAHVKGLSDYHGASDV